MSERKLVNRWLMVGAALVVQLCPGVLYAWSVFRPVFEKDYGWTKAESGFPYQVSLFFFALGVIIGGRIQDRVGPRRVVLTGGVMLALGAALTGAVGDSVVGALLTYGVLGGLGVGFVYVTPIATLIKWFPDKRGIITGIAVFGFGIAVVVFAPLISGLLTFVGIGGTFYILAVIFLVLVCGFGLSFRVPPAGWLPVGWNPPQHLAHVRAIESPLGRTLCTWQFWSLWLIYFIGTGVGLMTIGKAKSLGLDVAHVGDGLATAAVMFLGIFNAIGRLAWGSLSDRLGRTRTIAAMFAGYLVAFFGLMPWTNNAGTWLAGTCLVGFCYGGYVAIMPSLAADYYGTKSLGANYGGISTAYGIGGVVWPYSIDALSKSTGSFTWVWYIAAVSCMLGLVLAAVTRPPTPARE